MWYNVLETCDILFMFQNIDVTNITFIIFAHWERLCVALSYKDNKPCSKSGTHRKMLILEITIFTSGYPNVYLLMSIDAMDILTKVG